MNIVEHIPTLAEYLNADADGNFRRFGIKIGRVRDNTIYTKRRHLDHLENRLKDFPGPVKVVV